MCNSIYYEEEELSAIFQDDDLEVTDSDTSADYQESPRRVYFPSGFTAEVKRTLLRNFNNSSKICPLCNEPIVDGTKLSIDHKTAVSKYFNSKGWSVTQVQRAEWYNDTSNLQIVHVKCNSSKGGVRFETDLDVRWV